MDGGASDATTQRWAPVVTISASYGAGGSLVAPRLAEHLELPFIDRLLTADLSEEAGRDAGVPAGNDAVVEKGPPGSATDEPARSAAVRSEEGLSPAERAASPANRLFTYLARAASVGTVTPPPLDTEVDEALRARAEAGLAGIKAGAGGVVLGRAGAIVLARRPRSFHVRLDGPAERRCAIAARIEGIEVKRADERRQRTDRARELWVKRLYRTDTADAKWYHLVVDTTVLTGRDTVELIELALQRYLASGGAGPGTGWDC